MEIIEEDNDFSIYDFNSIINYIKNNFVQILLLFLVIFIIYTVEQITKINAMIVTPVSYINTQLHLQPQLGIKYPKGRKTSKK